MSSNKNSDRGYYRGPGGNPPAPSPIQSWDPPSMAPSPDPRLSFQAHPKTSIATQVQNNSAQESSSAGKTDSTKVSCGYPALWDRLELLQDPPIEVVVGNKDASESDKKGQQIWYLSAALLSYQSPFLKNECRRVAMDPSTTSVALLETSPDTFKLFVDWMFKGFSEESVAAYRGPTVIPPYAAAWILGAKLECIEFQNYAMEQLHTSSCTQSNYPLVIASAAMDKILAGGRSSLPLKKFMTHFIFDHFEDGRMVKGGLRSWTTVAQKHDDFLCDLLRTLKGSGNKMIKLRDGEYYMLKKPNSSIHPTEQTNGVVTPAKRGVDGMPRSKDTAALPEEIIGSSRADTREASIANDKADNTVKGDGKVVEEEKTEVVTPGTLTQTRPIKCEPTYA